MKIPFVYMWRSLWTRRLTTALTLSGIALVVFVFAAVLMLANGLEETLVETGSPDNAIVIRRAADSELVSQMDREAANIIRALPGIAAGADGAPLASGEVYVIINLLKKGSNDMGNVAVRGVGPAAVQLRPQVQLAEGRWFRSGAAEIIVGSNISGRFAGAAVGQELRFGDAVWTIVGRFDAGGTGFDSEIWGDADQLMPAFGRPVYSSLTLRLADPSAFAALKQAVEQDPRTQMLEVKGEVAYYRAQSQLMSDFIKALGLIVTIIFSFGAMIGAMITMYAAVANRTVEIGTMRALGFRRRSILGAFLVESALLALLGGAAGILLASFMSTVRISTTNFGTFSELGFGFALSPAIVGISLLFSLLMGLSGGFLPAVRASRLNILAALRSS